MEKFLLALLALPQELNVVNNEHINRAKLPLEARHVALLDCGDKPVDKFLAA